MNIYEHIKVIDENNDKICNMINKISSYTITSEASGTNIDLEFPVDMKFKDFKLYGKTEQVQTEGINLINHSANSQTVNGVTFTVNADKSITVNGTATADTVYTIYDNYSSTSTNRLVPGKTYTLSSGARDGTNAFFFQIAIRQNKADGTTESKFLQAYNNAATYTIPDSFVSADFTNIQLKVLSGYVANNVTIYPMFEHGNTASLYEPYTGGKPSPSPEYPQTLNSVGGDGNIHIDVMGKNHLNTDKFVELIKTYDETASEVVEDGRRCIKFDIFRLYKKDFSDVITFNKNKTYTWSMDIKFCERHPSASASDAYLTMGFLYNDELGSQVNIGNTISGVPLVNRRIINSMYSFEQFGKCSITSASNVPFNGIAFSYNDRGYWLIDLDSIQIEEGDKVTPYEPYKSTSLTLSTSNGLPGIAVDSDGEYDYRCDTGTYVSDIIDLKNGVHIQKIGVIESYNGEEITTPYMSTTGSLSTGAKVMYILDEPIETPLTEEEIKSYRCLHSCNDYTNISNSHDAYMYVQYTPEPNKYIDKLTEPEVPELDFE